MLLILLKIFIAAFLLNLFWEVSHGVLYLTCQKMTLNNYVKVILKASLKDAFFILLFYLITVLIFNNYFILQNYFQLTIFILVCLIFSLVDEIISLKLKRWEYTDKMPRIFKVGLSPLLEVALTGVISFILIFSLL